MAREGMYLQYISLGWGGGVPFSTFLLAGAEGFEPPNVGTKSRCLTTWRRPNEQPREKH